MPRHYHANDPVIQALAVQWGCRLETAHQYLYGRNRVNVRTADAVTAFLNNEAHLRCKRFLDPIDRARANLVIPGLTPDLLLPIEGAERGWRARPYRAAQPTREPPMKLHLPRWQVWWATRPKHIYTHTQWVLGIWPPTNCIHCGARLALTHEAARSDHRVEEGKGRRGAGGTEPEAQGAGEYRLTQNAAHSRSGSAALAALDENPCGS
jgi:hypothetical protein